MTRPPLHPVIIDLNLLYPVNGEERRANQGEGLVPMAVADTGGDQDEEGINEAKSALSEQYSLPVIRSDYSQAGGAR